MNEQILARALQQRLAEVEGRLAAACTRAGRARSDVTLVAVTKTITADVARLLPSLGIVHVGENRPQELWRKAAALPLGVHWHLIGHLQSNKIERTLPLVELIHSVDRVRVLDLLEQEGRRQGRAVPVLLEVNASGETSKQGFDPVDVAELVPLLRRLTQVQVRGLMTMAALQDPEACRPTFAELRRLRDLLRKELEGSHPVCDLSMGMSNDFEVAIEEGATYVRLGTVLFEGLPS